MSSVKKKSGNSIFILANSDCVDSTVSRILKDENKDKNLTVKTKNPCCIPQQGCESANTPYTDIGNHLPHSKERGIFTLPWRR